MSDDILRRLDYIDAVLRELLARVGGVEAQRDTTDPQYWPDGKLPVVTGNLSIDFTDAMMGGSKPATPERDASLAAHDAAQAAAMFAGRYPASQLSDVDAAFIYAASHREPGTALSNHVYWSAWLVSGSRNDIRNLIQRGENGIAGRTYQQVIDQYPDTELKRDFMGAR